MNPLRFCVLFLLVVKSLASIDELWQQWKRVYNKEYNGPDEVHRRNIWMKNVDRINAHNLRHDLSLVTYTLGLNKFSDMTFDEFKSKYLIKLPQKSSVLRRGTPYGANNLTLPITIDWRAAGYVTNVKDQANCSSSWAFSTTGSVEGQYIKNFGQQKAFSEQQLIDCSRDFGNRGCLGGLMENAFNYLMRYGLDEERNYPYQSQDDQCAYIPKERMARVVGYRVVRNGDEHRLQALVAEQGPTAVSIDVDEDFTQYKRGIYVSYDCSSDDPNHAALTVGYGTENGLHYWIVKNSWGEDWGEDGYIRMARDCENMCGIASQASVPIVVIHP